MDTSRQVSFVQPSELALRGIHTPNSGATTLAPASPIPMAPAAHAIAESMPTQSLDFKHLTMQNTQGLAALLTYRQGVAKAELRGPAPAPPPPQHLLPQPVRTRPKIPPQPRFQPPVTVPPPSPFIPHISAPCCSPSEKTAQHLPARPAESVDCRRLGGGGGGLRHSVVARAPTPSLGASAGLAQPTKGLMEPYARFRDFKNNLLIDRMQFNRRVHSELKRARSALRSPPPPAPTD